jgi:hypothetical protein
LREEHGLRVFENKALRKTFWLKMEKITGEWRRLHNGELYALYTTPNLIRVTKSRRIKLRSWGREEVHRFVGKT